MRPFEGTTLSSFSLFFGGSRVTYRKYALLAEFYRSNILRLTVLSGVPDSSAKIEKVLRSSPRARHLINNLRITNPAKLVKWGGKIKFEFRELVYGGNSHP